MYVDSSCNMVVSLFSVRLHNSIRCLNIQKCHGLTEEKISQLFELLFYIYYLTGLFWGEIACTNTSIYIHTYICIYLYAYEVSGGGLLPDSPQFLQAEIICLIQTIVREHLEYNWKKDFQ